MLIHVVLATDSSDEAHQNGRGEENADDVFAVRLAEGTILTFDMGPSS